MWRSTRGLNVCTAALLVASFTPFAAQASASMTDQKVRQEQSQQSTTAASDKSTLDESKTSAAS